MRKTPKKILGLFGLALVVAMTVFAAVLPSPEALAVSSVTDSIIVTVNPPANVANVNFLDHKDNVPYVNPDQNIKFNFSGVEQITITVEYTDVNNNTTSSVAYTETVSLTGGTKNFALDMANYGYGEYRLTLEGNGPYGAKSDYVAFSYVPVTVTVENVNNEINAVLDYDDNSADIDHFEIQIFDENGNLVGTVSPIDRPTKRVVLPFDNLPSGKYTVATIAFDASGNALYRSWGEVYNYTYTAPDAGTNTDEDIVVPNTGGLFMGLNVSKADYLVTGLIVFALVGGFGLFVILKKDKKKSTRKR